MEAIDPKELHPQTLLGLKLIQQPFSKRPNAENLFDEDALKQTRDTVSHHLQFSHMLMVVLGGKGSGKNSFANSLIVGEHPALYYFNATAEPDDTQNSLLSKAAKNNKADSIATMESRFRDILYRGQQPVLIVNDAHRLKTEALRDIITYSRDIKDENQEATLKLLLLGQKSLEDDLEHTGVVNHNLFYSLELPAFNVSNTRNFLAHRLEIAGFRDEFPFSDKEINTIFSNAGGNPEATLRDAARILNARKDLIDGKFRLPQLPKKILTIVGVLLLITATIYYTFLSGGDEPTTVSQRLDLQQQQKPSPSAVDQLFNNQQKQQQNTMDVKQPAGNDSLMPLTPPAINTARNTADNDANDPVKSGHLSQLDSIQPPVVNVDLDQQPKETASTAIPATDKLPAQQPDTAAETKPQPATTTIVKEPVAVKQEPARTEPVPLPLPLPQPVQKQPEPVRPATTAKPVEPRAPATIKPAPAVAPAPALTTSTPALDKTSQLFKNAGVHTADWLMQQPASNWSLQILAGYQSETLLSFAQQHKLKTSAAYFQSMLGSKPWHVLIYGQYKTRDEARAAIATLPSYIKAHKPWAKDMKSVQKSIKQTQK